MIRFSADIDIDRPIAEVFGFVADFENSPLWNYFVTRVTSRSDAPPAVGTVFHQVRRTDQQDYEIVALDRPRSVEIVTTAGSSPAFRIRYEFEDTAGGTRLRNRWWLETGHPAFLQRLGAARVRSAVGDNLNVLKALLETGSARLPDGRISTLPAGGARRAGSSGA